MKSPLLAAAASLTLALSAQAVLIDIDGQVQGPGEFGNYTALTTDAAITPASSVTDGPITLTIFAAEGAGVLWKSAWPTATPTLTYTAGQEINFQRGLNGGVLEGDTQTAAQAFSRNQFFDISLTTSGSNFTLSSLSVELWRNGGGAARVYQFAFDGNGGGWSTADLLGSETSVTGSGWNDTTDVPNQLATITYNASNIATDVSSATARLYFWAGTDTGGAGNTHLINVSATYTLVPEPSSAIALLVGMSFLAAQRRRRLS